MSGLYTYAVVDNLVEVTSSLSEIAPGLRAVAVGPVAAVVEDVDVGEYEGERLERNASDPEWLERAVRRHESVVESLLPRASVVPMRFGSIFSEEDGLHAMLEQSNADFNDLLDAVRGRREWGVRISADRDALVRRTAPAATSATSGGDYLRRRRAELQASETVGAVAAEAAEDVHRRLSDVAERAALLQPRQSTPDLLASAAYLVPVSNSDRFLATVEDLQGAHDGIRLDVTGPWPAYSFTSADVGGPRR